MMYIKGDVAIIQGKCPHVGVAPRYVMLQELSVKRLLSVWQKTHAWWLSCQHGIKGSQCTHAWWQHEYPINIQQRDLKTQHDESWQQVHHAYNSRHIKKESWKRVRNKFPHQASIGICAVQCIEKEVHEHTAYTSQLRAIWSNGCQIAKTTQTIDLMASITWKWLLAHECWHLHST